MPVFDHDSARGALSMCGNVASAQTSPAAKTRGFVVPGGSVIDDDSRRVVSDLRKLQAEPLNVRDDAHADQDPIDRHRRRRAIVDELDDLVAALDVHPDDPRVETNGDSVALEGLRQKLEPRPFLVAEKHGVVFHERDLGAEPREGLCQLAAQRSAADHQKTPRTFVRIEHVLVGHVPGVLEARNRRACWPSARRDERAFSKCKETPSTVTESLTREPSLAEEHIDALLRQTFGGIARTEAIARIRRTRSIAAGRIDGDPAGDPPAEALGVAHLAVQARRAEERLRRHAANVEGTYPPSDPARRGATLTPGPRRCARAASNPAGPAPRMSSAYGPRGSGLRQDPGEPVIATLSSNPRAQKPRANERRGSAEASR